jgi:membrane protease YdiL (CAAX protease family)
MLSERPWKVEAVAGLIAALMFGLVAASLVAIGLTHVLPGKSVLGNRFVQFVINTFTFQGLALILIRGFLRLHGVGWRELLGFDKVRWRTVAWAVIAALVALPLALGLNTLCAVLLTKVRVETVQQESMQVLQLSVSWGQKIVFAIGAIIMAPIVEESLFRGILYPMVKQQGYPRLALFGSSLLFAGIHFNLMTFVPLFMLALVLVLLLETTDTLLAPIITHACFNGANFFIYLNNDQITLWWHELTRGVRHALPI